MEDVCCKIVMFTLDVAVVVCIVVACLVCGQINLWNFHFWFSRNYIGFYVARSWKK